MDLHNFEKDFIKKIKSYDNIWDKDGRTLHLGEEVGEFMEIIMHYKGLKQPPKDKNDIANALADILDDVFSLAYHYDIDFDILLNKTLK
jgi:NTP pyrophosphatase (non-canonical NTP hydrolase)